MLTPDSLRISRTWDIWAGADTGTYMGGAIAAIDPNYECYVLEEFPNYHYTGDGTIELVGMTVGEWFKWFGTRLRHYTKQSRNVAWVDLNTTFKTEVSHGVTLRGNKKDLVLRTEITREYARNRRLHFMPWLKVIPYEAEECAWPEKESAGTGVLKRIKHKDHCWDGVEHICSRRPHPDFDEKMARKGNPLFELAERTMRPDVRHHDPHLGSN